MNIDKQKLNDPFYRYKMSHVELKDEGYGNGLRTVFLNLEIISKELNRDPQMIITYLSVALGCKHIKNKEETKDKEMIKWILYGRFTKDEIQKHLYDFIDIFVLCSHCRNPETKFVNEKKETLLSCSACSKQSNILLNKITMKIIKFAKLFE
ncbi:eukaryotic translation initiation factor eIF-5 [Bodo saltans virus]|uniref:Eukaryotic translation initiation factor eIF-5 n=1 Tax=Bodo saltans virus TaxID=2024608 RepID=A0A2H4UVF1_9VIRU|nr:eukaryotic translation initiation factor eIF-5 [Bodo saltans virus]ATZ80844.1 eukaryotic translation initiation factor eIF-5 [Bodo saltans virus]